MSVVWYLNRNNAEMYIVLSNCFLFLWNWIRI